MRSEICCGVVMSPLKMTGWAELSSMAANPVMQLPGILLRGCARMHGDMAEIGDAVEYVDEWMPFVGVAKTKAHFY